MQSLRWFLGSLSSTATVLLFLTSIKTRKPSPSPHLWISAKAIQHVSRAALSVPRAMCKSEWTGAKEPLQRERFKPGTDLHNPSTARERARSALRHQLYPNESSSLLIILFKSLSTWRRVSILLIECRTVVWCLPPNCLPISGSDADVSCLTRNMATWRG